MGYHDGAILIYARMGSKRLPKKAIKKVGGHKLIELVIKRVKLAKDIIPVKIYLATTNNLEDEELMRIAKQQEINVFRGDENDVVKRTVDFINIHNYKYICRVNGDCPFVDINLIVEGYNQIKKNYELVTNIATRTYPYGISVEWFKSKAYLKLSNIVDQSEAEHVTAHFYRMLDSIKYHNISNCHNNSHISLTIDNLVDLEKIDAFFKQYSKSEQIKISYKDYISNDYTI